MVRFERELDQAIDIIERRLFWKELDKSSAWVSVKDWLSQSEYPEPGDLVVVHANLQDYEGESYTGCLGVVLRAPSSRRGGQYTVKVDEFRDDVTSYNFVSKDEGHLAYLEHDQMEVIDHIGMTGEEYHAFYPDVVEASPFYEAGIAEGIRQGREQVQGKLQEALGLEELFKKNRPYSQTISFIEGYGRVWPGGPCLPKLPRRRFGWPGKS